MGLPDDIEMTPYCSIFMYDHIAAFVKQYQDDTGKDSGMVLMGIGYDLVSSVRDIISSPEELAMLFKALSEPSRLDIINLLRESPAYGQELSEKTALHPTTISHHMARLVAANLVECDLRTAKTYYTLNPLTTAANPFITTKKQSRCGELCFLLFLREESRKVAFAKTVCLTAFFCRYKRIRSRC